MCGACRRRYSLGHTVTFASGFKGRCTHNHLLDVWQRTDAQCEATSFCRA